MVLVENISVILEDNNYILYVQTANGVCTQKISDSWAKQFQQTMHQDINMKKKLSTISMTQCKLLWKEDNFIAYIKSHKEYQGPWEEALFMALVLEIPIYIDAKVLVNDYCIDESHELFVQELLEKEQKYWETANTIHLVQKLNQDIIEKSSLNSEEECSIKLEKTKQIGK